MATVNVNRKVTDSYYRYKMPKIMAKIEGRGNGIKTLIVNLTEISKSLKRPVMYVLKYIGCEVGALSNADPKADRYVVNGVHDSDKLQVVMDGFIDRYVLCSGCGNPETNICVYPKREKIALKCIACGTITNVPTSHKISSFMFKNPPPESKKAKAKAVSTRAKKIDEQMGEIDVPDQLGDTLDDLDLPDSYKKDVEELTSRVSLLTTNNASEKKTKVRLEILENFIKGLLAKENDLNVHYDAITAEVKRLALAEKYIFALCSCILDENIVSQLRVHHSGLSKFVFGCVDTQKYFLGWLECLINSHESKLLPLVSTLFKMLYDADIIAEESFFTWKKKKKSRYVSLDFLNKLRTAAEKFMTWLETAEEESSDVETEEESASEEEDVEPEQNESARRLPTIDEVDEKADEEFNIDEI